MRNSEQYLLHNRIIMVQHWIVWCIHFFSLLFRICYAMNNNEYVKSNVYTHTCRHLAHFKQRNGLLWTHGESKLRRKEKKRRKKQREKVYILHRLGNTCVRYVSMLVASTRLWILLQDCFLGDKPSTMVMIIFSLFNNEYLQSFWWICMPVTYSN